MSLLFRLVVATACPSTHHRLAMDALLQLRCVEADDWRRLFLNYYEGYLRGAKAPDDEFKDFKNHVLHVRDGYWGGAVSAAQLWYDRCVMALRREYWADAIYAAGVLSHYVTDPFMPLHTGQTEEEGKVHRAVEWSVTKSYDELRSIVETQQGGFPTVLVPEGPTWLGALIKQGAEAAHEHYFAVLEHYHLAKGVQDPLAGMDQDLKQRMARQIGLAVSALARVLDRAISEARARPPMVELVVETLLATVKMPLRRIMQRLDDAEDREEVEEIYEEVRSTGKAIDSLSEDDAEVRRLHCEQVLRIPLKQLDATPARPTGLKHRLGEATRQRSSRSGTSWDGAIPADPSPLVASSWSSRGGDSTLRMNSSLTTAGGSEASRRVVVPSNRLPSLQSGGRGTHRRRRRYLPEVPSNKTSAPATSRHAATTGEPVEPRRLDADRAEIAAPPAHEARSERRLRRRAESATQLTRVRDRANEEGSQRPPRRDSNESLDDRDSQPIDSHDDDRDEGEDAEDQTPRRAARPGRFRRRLRVEATRAARAVQRGVRQGLVLPAAALGRAVKNVAQRVRRRRPDDERDVERESRAADESSLDSADEAPSDRRADTPTNASHRSALRFYLDESHSVVDAPAIGPKTARRLEAAGIHTVADLLNADPETLSAQLDIHWADAAKISQWQSQAELASRVPQLRGHDAQVLAAVGVTSTDELATMDADSLWELVEPFLKSPQAEQILRGGNRPDRGEVAEWLRWAQSARPRRAA